MLKQISENLQMEIKYKNGQEFSKNWGVYQTSEGAFVRHHDAKYIKSLMNNFTCNWFIEENFVTMNNNPVRSFHGIYIK